MICRRRVSLRVVFTVAIVFLLFLFFTTLTQFNDIESPRKFRPKIEYNDKYQVEIESELDQSKRLEKLKAKFSNRFNNQLERIQVKDRFAEFNNHKIDMDQYDNGGLESMVNLDYFKAVESMEKIVHLDLKGAPPKLTYLKEFIPYIKKLGATGILIEYEDFFPYENELEAIKNQNHYTKQELSLLFDIITENKLKIIPLMQSYGHLEFVLKLKQFAHLREHKSHFQVITPCLTETYVKVLFKMIDQILDIHPKNVEYLHIGCDEGYHINVNPACSSGSLNHLKTTDDFFIYHVTKLVNYIKEKRPNLKIMIWDDMIRKNMISNMSLNLKQFAKKIIPMVWNYKGIVEIDRDTLKLYDSIFDEIWVGTAFKGATSRLELIPNSRLHYYNHLSWLNLIKTSKNPNKYRGIALTGWSRYDHMQSVCEILPAGIPSLVLCLQTLIYFKEGESLIFQKAKELTKCNYQNSPTGFILDISTEKIKTNENLYQCDFPGSKIYNWLLNLKIATKNFQHKYDEYSSILNSFNLKYNFFNTMYYEKTLLEFPIIKNKFKMLENTGEKEFDKYFYADLFEEITNVYIERYVDLIDKRLNDLNKTKQIDNAFIRPFNKIVQTLV